MPKYKVVEGKKLELALLNLGQSLTRRSPLDLDGARKLWESALDGNKVTEIERNTILHIMKTASQGVTPEARTFLDYWLGEKHVTELKGAQHEVVDNVRCDRPMIQAARHYERTAGGSSVGVRGAEGIWFCALDGRGVTQREKDTLDLILGKYSFEVSAKEFLHQKAAWLSVAAAAVAVDAGGPSLPPTCTILSRPDAVALEVLGPPPLPPPAAPPPSWVSCSSSRAISLAPAVSGEHSGSRSAASSSSAHMAPGSSLALAALARLSHLASGLKRKLGLGSRNAVAAASSQDALALVTGRDPEVPPTKRRRCSLEKITLAKLRKIFARCDRNNDGTVNKRELIISCRENDEVAQFFGLSKTIRQEDGSRTSFENWFQDVDRDGDREICWAELLAYYRHAVSDF